MSIATKAVSGAAWNLAAGVGSRVISLVGTLILTRFIAPAEYGEIAAAHITIITTLAVTDASVGQSILARRIGPDVCFHAFVLHVVACVLGMLPVVFLSGHIGAWLDAPGMARFVPWFAAAALLERVSYVPGRLLVRDLRFRTVALVRGSAELAFTGTAVCLAPFVGGYAIIGGNLARWTLIAVAYLLSVESMRWWAPQRLRWSAMRDLLDYGLPLSAGRLARFASANWDNLLVGRFFGTSTMGAYRLSRNLADTPATNVAEQIGDVLLPSFAQMDVERRRNALVRAASIMALLISPLSIGLAAIAPTLVATLFDERWGESAPMLMILSALSLVRPVAWTLTSFLEAQQRPRTLMLLSFLNVGVMLLLVVAIGQLGPYWICAAVGLASVVHFAASLLVVNRADGVSARTFLAGVLRPFVACVPMFGAVMGVRYGLQELGLAVPAVSLVVETIVGAAVYVAGALIVAGPILDDVLALLRSADFVVPHVPEGGAIVRQVARTKSTVRWLAGNVYRWNGVMCLMYHRIGDGRGSAFDRALWSATPAGFEEQLRWLKGQFDVISPGELSDVSRLKRGRHVLITFDDGYDDNFTAAYPILRALRLPATFFVATGFIDNPRLPWWDEVAWMVRRSPRTVISLPSELATSAIAIGDRDHERERERAVLTLLRTYKRLPVERTRTFLDAVGEATASGRYAAAKADRLWMTWDMLREMQAGGMTIGGHSVNHQVLSRMTRDEQWTEISGCSRRLEEELGVRAQVFAYPVGKRDSFNTETRECLQKAGVRTAFSYYGGFRRVSDWDDYDVPRTAVEQDTTFDEFRARVMAPWL